MLICKKKIKLNTKCIYKVITSFVIITGDLKKFEKYLATDLKEIILVCYYGVKEDVENHRFSVMLQLGLMKKNGLTLQFQIQKLLSEVKLNFSVSKTVCIFKKILLKTYFKILNNQMKKFYKTFKLTWLYMESTIFLELKMGNLSPVLVFGIQKDKFGVILGKNIFTTLK